MAIENKLYYKQLLICCLQILKSDQKIPAVMTGLIKKMTVEQLPLGVLVQCESFSKRHKSNDASLTQAGISRMLSNENEKDLLDEVIAQALVLAIEIEKGGDV